MNYGTAQGNLNGFPLYCGNDLNEPTMCEMTFTLLLHQKSHIVDSYVDIIS